MSIDCLRGRRLLNILPMAGMVLWTIGSESGLLGTAEEEAAGLIARMSIRTFLAIGEDVTIGHPGMIAFRFRLVMIGYRSGTTGRPHLGTIGYCLPETIGYNLGMTVEDGRSVTIEDTTGIAEKGTTTIAAAQAKHAVAVARL